MRNWRTARVALAGGIFLLCGRVAEAQLLLRDDFDGAGNVDTTVWRLPFGDAEGTFVGRTQFRGDSATDVPQQGIAEGSAADGKVMEIHLDTFSPIDPGNQFLGTDVLTKRNFARAGGLSYEARLRLKPTPAGGLVGGFFTFDVTRESPPGTLVRDEIDVELISNQTVGAATQDPFTNVWNDGSFASPGNGGYVDIGGFNLTQFHDYRVDWTPQSVKWFVDDQLVRTVNSNVPNDPMKLHFNLWAPDTDFEDAFNAALQPAATVGANQRYTLQIDHVEVNRTDTTTSANLLTDASFETTALTAKGSVPETTTGKWLSFGHVFRELDDIGGTNPGIPDMAVDGIFMLKQYGPFFALPNASGVVQNVVAAPGEQFEASVWAQTAAGDSIDGSSNFNTIELSFLNSTGAVIEDAPFVPTDGNDFPLLDGRDPNLPEDTWVQGIVDAIAPSGTAYARVSLFFKQSAIEGGASWFDAASLVKLTPNAVVGLLGDYNGNDEIDAADFTVWRDALTAGSSTLLNDPTPGSVNESDFIYWRDHFGAVLGSGSGAASAVTVPEPNSFVLLVLGLVFSLVCCRSPMRRN